MIKWICSLWGKPICIHRRDIWTYILCSQGPTRYYQVLCDFVIQLRFGQTAWIAVTEQARWDLYNWSKAGPNMHCNLSTMLSKLIRHLSDAFAVTRQDTPNSREYAAQKATMGSPCKNVDSAKIWMRHRETKAISYFLVATRLPRAASMSSKDSGVLQIWPPGRDTSTALQWSCYSLVNRRK